MRAGYMMAFGAMTALARRAREGGSWHVRVSLAQTGHWMRRLGRIDGLGLGTIPASTMCGTVWAGARVRFCKAHGRTPFRSDVGNAAALGKAVGAAWHT